MSADQAKEATKGVLPLLIFLGVGAVVAPPTIIVLTVGMIPSIVATFVNPSRVKGSIAAMTALNLAGVVPVIGFLWERGHTIDQAMRLLTDVFMWLLMFGGAGIAAFLLWGVPIVVQGVYEVQARHLVGKLEKRRMKMIEEWGGRIVEDSKTGVPGSAKSQKKESDTKE
ncbi:hypothetical protein GUA87_13925 [Sneathiella sp. P13V-1]|uniref:hypothetical protein n=1 Tax=Sneathiella sp. P13V-1 TaxID=2697366 RepID=UPI00187B5668|nr:hypothetical protein [Sneathiella sp. P13V-1]MBE7637951.1 hypothetical protein [Sneathiella sp. P13V-1]